MVSKESDNDDDKSYSDDSDSDTKSDSESDTESETDEQPDNDNKNGLIDSSYKGPDFEPKPFKLVATNEGDNGHGEILNNNDHQSNPTVAIEDNAEATADTSTPNVEPPIKLRQSMCERREPERYGFAHLDHCHNMVTIDDAIE